MSLTLRAGEAQQQDLDGLTLCVLHQPSMWESDGTCPLCEGQRLHAALAAERALAQRLREKAKHFLEIAEEFRCQATALTSDVRPEQHMMLVRDELRAVLAASTPTGETP